MRERARPVRLPCVTAAISSSWPASRNEFWSWQVRGACRTVGPSLFYSPEGERGSRKRRRESSAKAICATCEVAEICAAYALAWREPYGTWGGLSEADHVALNGIDRWVGGVHLHGKAARWRWDEGTESVAATA